MSLIFEMRRFASVTMPIAPAAIDNVAASCGLIGLDGILSIDADNADFLTRGVVGWIVGVDELEDGFVVAVGAGEAVIEVVGV
jgi:hypothetical protein